MYNICVIIYIYVLYIYVIICTIVHIITCRGICVCLYL